MPANIITQIPQEVFSILQCPNCHTQLTGEHSPHYITCASCNSSYPVVNNVIDFTRLYDEVAIKTANHYGTGWLDSARDVGTQQQSNWHYDEVIKIAPNPTKLTGIGLEVGCGHGKDTVRLAQENPDAHLISLDLSDGVFVTQQRLTQQQINNVTVIKGSALNLPIKDNSINWVYSFGVLHHTTSPEQGFKEISRVGKQRASVTMYLYSDLKEFPLLRLGMQFTKFIRLITKRLPLPALKLFCKLFTPIIFILFTLPARLLKASGFKRVGNRIPYGHSKDLNEIYGELYDRFGAQIEHRYNKNSLTELYKCTNIDMQGIGQIPIWRGWVSWGEVPGNTTNFK